MQRFAIECLCAVLAIAALALPQPLRADGVATRYDQAFAVCDDRRCVAYAAAVTIDEIMTAAWLRVTRDRNGSEQWHAAVALAPGGDADIRTIAIPLRVGRSLGRSTPHGARMSAGFAYVELDQAQAGAMRGARAGSFAVIRAATSDGDTIEATIPLDGLQRALDWIETGAGASPDGGATIAPESIMDELKAAGIPPADRPDR